MQQQMLHRLLAGAVAGMFIVSTATAAGAAGPRREGMQPPSNPGVTGIFNQKLVLTSMEGDSTHYALNAGFSNIGTPYNFNCAHACTVVVQTMLQVEEMSPYWAICPTIDELDAVDGCNWQGSTSSSSAVYVTGSGTYIWSLAAGKHTLQPQVYLNVAGGIDNWALTFMKYNPN